MERDPKWRVLFSHHPPCTNFAHHTLNIKELQFCIGCFVGIPSMILGAFLGHMMLRIAHFSGWNLLLIGFGFLSTQLLSLTGLTDHKGVKILQKIFMGFGAGSILFAVYNLLHLSIFLKHLILIVIIFIGRIPPHYLHIKSSKQVCNECDKKWKKDECPTDYCFADIPNKIRQNDQNISEN